jgi:hypothetical protein
MIEDNRSDTNFKKSDSDFGEIIVLMIGIEFVAIDANIPPILS